MSAFSCKPRQRHFANEATCKTTRLSSGANCKALFSKPRVLTRTAVKSFAAKYRGTVSASATAPSAEDLNSQHGIPGSVSVVEGECGNPKVVLTHESGASAEVYLFGACISSWKQVSGDEVLYIRPDAKFDKSKPISGGIPHCFPQFGPGEIQQHGFARNLDWEISSTSSDLSPDEKDPEVELCLVDNDYTRSMWDHKFKLVYSVSLHGEELRTHYRVVNTGDKPFTFTAALHSYIEVAGIQNARVRGLKGLTYLDKVEDAANPAKRTQQEDLVAFSGPKDSVYLGAPEYIELDVGTGAAVALSSTGWEDVVVWSPWDAMPDCYEHFCCVENARVGNPVTVPPGESWEARADFKVIDL
uniref:glucose-6-phosphate 1-epimerase n=1 Tax=Tetraselmis sp. GSL018 TaxID=582737 RepID=A0A061S2K6_9CHLO|mmetsp:Transcript_9041/g.21765  ORF Transcript_9041/g.21765 Transcript_9041/m.21765 type:complete len:358 (-) Transcript_9041:174-1247(-)